MFSIIKKFIDELIFLNGRHPWLYESRKSERLVFYTRTCSRCGLFQIQKAGPMGNGQWVSEADAFEGPVGRWEREQFNSCQSNQG